LIFLEFAIFNLVVFLVLFRFLEWIKNKRPRLKNICSFLVELGSAYSLSFALDLVARSAVGELQSQKTILPIGTWTSWAIVLHCFARGIATSNKPLFIAYLMLGVIAASVSFIHPHNLFVGLPLLLIALMLFHWQPPFGDRGTQY